jgi:carboxymethylenebutenolidase
VTLGREVHLGDPSFDAYASLPGGAARGVVVIHEVFGRAPEIDRVVDRFAARGYAAIAPDLFGSSPRPLCIARMLRVELTGRGSYAAMARRSRDYLVERAGLSVARVGIIGFCIGAGFALAVAPGWGAVSANYGTTPRPRVLEGSPPVIACYGDRDRAMRRQPETLRRRLEVLGVPHEIHVFEGVGHAFLTDGDHPIATFLTRHIFDVRHAPCVAAEAFERILTFFDAHLVDDDRAVG